MVKIPKELARTNELTGQAASYSITDDSTKKGHEAKINSLIQQLKSNQLFQRAGMRTMALKSI